MSEQLGGLGHDRGMRYGRTVGTIRLTREIDAPPGRVWDVVADLGQYEEWNPFVVHAASTLTVGDPIRMRVRLLPFFTQPQRETILACEPGSHVCWGLPGGPASPIRSRRCQEIRADGARTRYVSDFALDGWLAPVVMALLGTRLRAGFEAMTDAVKRRAEMRPDRSDGTT